MSLFGSLLDNLARRVNDIIQGAIQDVRNAGIEILIEAGQEIGLAIELVKNAYEAELNETLEKVSKKAKEAFDRIDSLVQRYATLEANILQELMGEAQRFSNSLPFANKQPQLISVRPRHLVTKSDATASLVVLKGNFLYAATKGFTPSLTFEDKSCYLVDSNTTSLTFQVPHSVFKDTPADKYSYKTGTLVVPWDNGLIWSNKQESTFRIGLAALPRLAGHGKVLFSKTAATRKTEQKSNSYYFNGNDYYPTHWKTVYTKIYPTPGWLIDVSKPPTMNVRHDHGDHQQGIESFSATEIVLKVDLYCKDGHSIGIVNVTVGFEQYKDEPSQFNREETFELQWSGSLLLKPQTEESIYSVSFDDYKGVHNEYAAPSTRDVLKIEAQGNGIWKIWAEPPKELSLAASDLPAHLATEIAQAKRRLLLGLVENVNIEL